MKTSIMKIGMALLCIAAVLTAPVCAAPTSDQTTTGPYQIAYPFPVEEQKQLGELAYPFPVEEQKKPGNLAYPHQLEEQKQPGELAYPFPVEEQKKPGNLTYPYQVEEQEAASTASTGTAGQGGEEFKFEIIMIRAHIAAFDHILELFEDEGYETTHAKAILKDIGRLTEALEEAYSAGDEAAVKSIHEKIKLQSQNLDRAVRELIPAAPEPTDSTRTADM
jgi:hypothetical protein